MCSIEEAWAGQTFEGKTVSSQGDIHNAYMSLPNNVLNRGNEFMVNNPNQPQSRSLIRGINSKYSREPRVPKINRDTNNVNANISSVMPDTTNYGGLDNMPSYMKIYDNADKMQQDDQSVSSFSQQAPHSPYSTYSSYPQATMTGENFTDIENAFNVSDTLDNFMNKNTNNNNNNNNNNKKHNLIDENTVEESEIINNKFSNFKNINSKNSNQNNDDTNIKQLLISIMNKLDKIEIDLQYTNKRNMYDIVLYIIIGMILSVLIYSLFSGMRK